MSTTTSVDELDQLVRDLTAERHRRPTPTPAPPKPTTEELIRQVCAVLAPALLDHNAHLPDQEPATNPRQEPDASTDNSRQAGDPTPSPTCGSQAQQHTATQEETPA